MSLVSRTSPALIVPVLGITQILAWGSSYYLPAVIAPAVSADAGWPLAWIVGGSATHVLAPSALYSHS